MTIMRCILLLTGCVHEPVPDDTIASVGAFFGECLGPCQKTVVFDGDAVVLRIEDWGSTAPLAEQQGTLTKSGSRWRDEVAEALVAKTLDPVYGCPDCADGGGMRLVLEVGGGLVEHTWEHGSPPPVLAEVDRLFHELRDALEGCSDTADVEIAGTCTPFSWSGTAPGR